MNAIGQAECLVCGGEPVGLTYPFGTDWGGRRFDYLRCGACGSSFLHPLPTGAEFASMYDRSRYHDEYYAGGHEEEAVTFLSRVADLLPAGGCLLDFGCGNGAFLRTAARAGFDAVGVELEESARVNARALSGRPVFALDELLAGERRFDIVHMGDVLEHLPDPADAMRRLEALLSPRGVFFIEGPLEDNRSPVFWAARLFGGLKRLRGRPLHGSLPPFHLFRTHAKAQRDFFETRLGHRVERFIVDESGWPYWNDERVRDAKGAGQLLKMAIGRAGVTLAKATAPLGFKIGNRFAAVLRPTARPS